MDKNNRLKSPKSALKWIMAILRKKHIPFQIAGGLAAIAHGATRPLADIDIDISEEDFPQILDEISAYIIFGPARYKSKYWDLVLVTLNYKGQAIDISGAYTTKIFNKKRKKWQKIKTDFNKTEIKKVFGLTVPVIARDALINYKAILNRKVDQIDVQQIRDAIKRLNQTKMNTLLSKLTKKKKDVLFEALYYMNMQEIKDLCKIYDLPCQDKKGIIIDRIKHFMQTGEVLPKKKVPPISFAKKDVTYPLKPNTLILKGAYRNNLKTRKFFQTLIGELFHFTAFGQDWILDRWQRGKPPTYIEFAKYWQQQYVHRKKSVAKPKQEWAYLSFMQRFQKNQPLASKVQATVAWEKTRAEKVAKVRSILLSSL